jgi:hypothetical protein
VFAEQFDCGKHQTGKRRRAQQPAA